MALKDHSEGKSSQWQDIGQCMGEMARFADLYQFIDYEWFGLLAGDLGRILVEN